MNSEGVVKLERVRVRCPGCGEEVEAVAADGRVKGYCAVARRYVDFVAETQPICIGKNPAAETSPVKDGVVCDYLAGVKTVVIQDRYGISPGALYRVLHNANVK
ncbi:unnamed protein product, partial [marine sediment metagenome]